MLVLALLQEGVVRGVVEEVEDGVERLLEGIDRRHWMRCRSGTNMLLCALPRLSMTLKQVEDSSRVFKH